MYRQGTIYIPWFQYTFLPGFPVKLRMTNVGELRMTNVGELRMTAICLANCRVIEHWNIRTLELKFSIAV